MIARPELRLHSPPCVRRLFPRLNGLAATRCCAPGTFSRAVMDYYRRFVTIVELGSMILTSPLDSAFVFSGTLTKRGDSGGGGVRKTDEDENSRRPRRSLVMVNAVARPRGGGGGAKGGLPAMGSTSSENEFRRALSIGCESDERTARWPGRRPNYG